MLISWTVFLSLACFVNVAQPYKILAVLPFPSKSHYAIPDPLLVGLAEKGHEVTVYNPYLKKKPIPNYKEVYIGHCFPAPTHILTMDTMRALSETPLSGLLMLFMFRSLHADVIKCEPIAELYNSTEKYDLFITESFQTDLLLTIADKFKVPIITVIPNVLLPWLSERLGNPDNPSYVPSLFTGYLSDMNYKERVVNTFMYLVSVWSYNIFGLRHDDALAREILGFPDDWSLFDTVKRTSIIFTNSHSSVNPVVPLVPGVVEIGGIHIKPAKPIDKNIEKFINESEHGVVYFCMGSLLRGETFPEEKRNAFLYAFSKIPQRVLWKWEGDVLPGKSDKIMISKWMPQRDILAHPNVKLFISHGGLLGTSEAVYEGVPVLGIPIFGDQRTNVRSLEANGAGELLDYNEITKDVVLEKIQRLLNDPKYRENAKALSERYRDRPMSPLDTAVYWTEYVIRHKGAPHLRTAAADMPWYQYLLLDVIAFLLAVLTISLAIFYYTTRFILRCIYNLICGKSKPAAKTDARKKRN